MFNEKNASEMRIGIVVCNYNVQQSEIPNYIGSVLTGLAAQLFPGKIDILVADNMSSPAFLKSLGKFCESNSNEKRSFSYISEPMHQTLWNSLNLGFYALKSHCECDIFGYSSDDVWFNVSDIHGLERVVKEFDDPSLGIVSVQTNIDNAERSYKNLNSTSGTSVKLKLWEIINLHFMLFSKEFMETYDYRYVDTVIWGNESLLPFMCAAIDKDWLLSRKSMVNNGKRKKRKKPKGSVMGFHVVPEHAKSLKEMLSPGHSVGLGFNCFNRIAKLTKQQIKGLPGEFFWMDYDESLYDEHNRCKIKDQLLSFIKNNIFLKSTDYSNRLEKADRMLSM